MGYVELKSASSSKPSASNSGAIHSGPAVNNSQTEPAGGKAGTLVSQHAELIDSARDHVSKAKPADGRSERAESVSTAKSDPGHLKHKGASLVNGSDAQASVPSATLQAGTSRPIENQVQLNETSTRRAEENTGKLAAKNTSESEVLYFGEKTVFLNILCLNTSLRSSYCLGITCCYISTEALEHLTIMLSYNEVASAITFISPMHLHHSPF